MEHNSVEDGFQIIVDDNGKKIHSFLVREGCTGSPFCAMEWYVSNNHDWLNGGYNIHFSDEEMESMYKAIKAVRKARKKARKPREQ